MATERRDIYEMTFSHYAALTEEWKHLLNEKNATVSATIAPGQVMRALNDSCEGVLCLALNLPCFGFVPAKFGPVHPFHESTFNKPFQAYQKYS